MRSLLVEGLSVAWLSCDLRFSLIPAFIIGKSLGTMQAGQSCNGYLALLAIVAGLGDLNGKSHLLPPALTQPFEQGTQQLFICIICGGLILWSSHYSQLA